jgi:hypothetical protein
MPRSPRLRIVDSVFARNPRNTTDIRGGTAKSLSASRGGRMSCRRRHRHQRKRLRSRTRYVCVCGAGSADRCGGGGA